MKRDIKEAMAFLTHCNLLKIEDILPFFPDFVLIDSFKEEVCLVHTSPIIHCFILCIFYHFIMYISIFCLLIYILQICKSLEEYNKHIEELKAEMDDATRSADLIRLGIFSYAPSLPTSPLFLPLATLFSVTSFF